MTADADAGAAMLDAIQFRWGDLYRISSRWGQLTATHREDGTVICASSLLQLGQRLNGDHTSRAYSEFHRVIEMTSDLLARAAEELIRTGELRGDHRDFVHGTLAQMRQARKDRPDET